MEGQWRGVLVLNRLGKYQVWGFVSRKQGRRATNRAKIRTAPSLFMSVPRGPEILTFPLWRRRPQSTTFSPVGVRLASSGYCRPVRLGHRAWRARWRRLRCQVDLHSRSWLVPSTPLWLFSEQSSRTRGLGLPGLLLCLWATCTGSLECYGGRAANGGGPVALLLDHPPRRPWLQLGLPELHGGGRWKASLWDDSSLRIPRQVSLRRRYGCVMASPHSSPRQAPLLSPLRTSLLIFHCPSWGISMAYGEARSRGMCVSLGMTKWSKLAAHGPRHSPPPHMHPMPCGSTPARTHPPSHARPSSL